MSYDPQRDLYQLLAVPADAGEEQIRYRIEGLRGVRADADLDLAARVLLHLESRTRYDTERAQHRLRAILREGFGVFAGRNPARGIATRSGKRD